ncbi:metal ABC transporter permease [Stappia sp. MMSF_3263]|uniref:metal ABC transporter permease n=1 Tax=Stappia sp. MMSF_3263 TaxID=3046693 RepID=UPI00273D6481|nr:metal ABC transporter permease [Stappia sp. MMSF_3263]
MSTSLSVLADALLLQGGYNAALVAIGAALLGIAAGAGGTFLFLRKRALVSDAIAHATLPGVGLAFLAMVAFGLDGRSLIGLIAGSALSAAAGLFAVEWITRRTRLAEDTAIGAVLSVFFGFGIVLLTVIQTQSQGRQAGLEGFLLGSTAGMLFQDAVVIAVGGVLAIAALVALRRPMTMVAFDPGFAAATGVNTGRVDMAMMMLVLAVTVTGLKIVGLVLIVALLIIPAVAARLWSERTDRVILAAGAIGGVSGYLGAAISAAAPGLPTGPIIVLVSFALFLGSLLFAPQRGVLAAAIRHRSFQLRLHRRQGLLSLARSEPIFDPLTLRVLQREGLIRTDRVATEDGRAAAARALRDERRFEIAREIHRDDPFAHRYDGLTPIEDVMTPDEIAEIDRLVNRPLSVGAPA